MGMTIEELVAENDRLNRQLAYESTALTMMKADYEARLKGDMVAMLTEIQLEIEELDNPLDYDFEGYNQCAVDCEKLIQQKINSLKEVKDVSS